LKKFSINGVDAGFIAKFRAAIDEVNRQ
jgi:hypothetical protein